MGVKEQLGITKRASVAGLPIGPKQTDWSRVATLGAAATAAGSTIVRRVRHHDSNGQEHQGVVANLKERGEHAFEASPIGQLVEKGKSAAETVSGIGERVGDAQEAAGEHSTAIGKAFAAVKAFTGGDGGEEIVKKQRLIIEEQVDISAPRSQVYNQWTQFEDFPTFSRAVESVDQDDEDEVTKWQAKILFSRRHWQSDITEQIPDQRIVWETSGDVNHRGIVSFHELDDHLTRVQVDMEYFPGGFVEKFGNLFLTVRHRVRKDLRLFKHWVEFESEETGAWRGRIEDGEVTETDDGEQPRGEDGRFVSNGDEGEDAEDAKDDEEQDD